MLKFSNESPSIDDAYRDDMGNMGNDMGIKRVQSFILYKKEILLLPPKKKLNTLLCDAIPSNVHRS